MASALAVAHRRDVRRLRRQRKEQRPRIKTADDRLRHELTVITRQSKSNWTPEYAARLGIPWENRLAFPDEFRDYRYWQARHEGWDILFPQFASAREWWANLDPQTRDMLADLGWSKVKGTGDFVDAPVNPKTHPLCIHHDPAKVGKEWGRRNR